MPTRSIRLAGAALVAGLGLASLAACGNSDDSGSGSSSSSGGGGKKIALLLPESKTTRYETFDRPLFEAAVKKDCADCTIIYSNADQDPAKQQQQAEAALTQGANVLVLDPVDGKAAAVGRRQRQGPGRSRRRLRPVHRRRRLLRLVRQRDGRQDPGPDAGRHDQGRRQDVRRHRDDQRFADRPQRRRSSRRAPTASSTPAASRSLPSTTPRTGAPTRPRPGWRARSRPSRATSSASTRPTTAPAVARSPRSRPAASAPCRPSRVRTPSSPRSSGSSPATRP